ncbi:MAG: TonB-dependent receptor [Saprospiraceae bacterium]|nr:TonB-dependent receptor [Saprospiraceae bacterium]
MRTILTLSLLFSISSLFAQSSIQGQLQDPDGQAVAYANVALYQTADSSLYKVETSDESGIFRILNLGQGNYFLKATYVGLQDLVRTDISLTAGQDLDFGVLSFSSGGQNLEEVTVTASRAMVEVKPDRTVFNVQGTINSIGEDALSLMRKAPGVTVDNNDNINVLGRSGVRIFIDGKPLPLGGQERAAYLKNIPAEQIDRIDIISNPGAKYEAEGNAGIIDIRLKRDKSLGTNGSVSTTFSQGRYARGNVSATANYRNKALNVFGTLGAGMSENFNEMEFRNWQNGVFTDEINNSVNENENVNYRIGTDFFIGKRQTLGFLVSGGDNTGNNSAFNRVKISEIASQTVIDSVLIAENTSDNTRDYNTYNLNYRFDISKEQNLNIDLDYGKYKNESDRFQPNRYYDPTETNLVSQVINAFDTGTDIDITTAKVDYENTFAGGKLGFGGKYSQVVSENTFLYFDQIDGINDLNEQRSNDFDYDEKVYAGYISYNRPISQKLSFSAGLRAEKTDATGDLIAYDPSLQEDPVIQDYINWFPNAGLTWTPQMQHSFALNYGRRINRPNYQVLNPFNNRLSELSFEKGNPNLVPEIVNNVELGYTRNFRYNFKLSYSLTENQITRLIGPDENDPRAGFITWENLAKQHVINGNASLPMQPAKKWSMYTNLSASYINNQADYGEGAVVDVQAFTYSIFQQHTIDLPWQLKGEISGYFSGPGVWGGVFKYNENWALNLGLQRKFFQDKLFVKISANDIFYEQGWDGESVFDGLTSEGAGNWDSRRASISLSYNFGNQNVKSRKRKTGLEEEGKRVGN